MQQKERLAGLRRIKVLAELAEAPLADLARTCSWHDYEAGEQILSYQDPSTRVFFLAVGKVRVIVYSAEGRAVVFTDLVPGTIFGEIGAIDRAPRSAGVEALEQTSVASLTADQFETVMLRQPTVALATLRHVTAEVRRLSERVVEFSTLMVQNRIHAELLRLAASAGAAEGQVLLSPTPSLSDIADRISTHREAVSRELSRLAAIGLLRREASDLRITDIARLAALVREAKGE
jgi:CRP/FNR family cyclic AMP-dependent transcriptional regulator